MIDRFRLSVPDSLEPTLYWSSCRAVLSLTTCLGLQLTTLLMIAIGPLAESPYDPATLTAAGRFFLSVEYDTQAYAAGCFATVLLACIGLWAWNRHVLRAGPDRVESAVRSGRRFQLGLAAASFVAFCALLAWLGPESMDSSRVALGTLFLLAAPGALTTLVLVLGSGIARRRTGG